MYFFFRITDVVSIDLNILEKNINVSLNEF